MASNYEDVLAQITGFGLQVSRLDIGRMARCRVENDKEKRGWYILHEITLSGGDTVLVGSYGIWQGADANAQKIELEKIEFSAEQKAAIKQRIADDKKRADAEQKRRAEQSALRADKAWRNLQTDGDCDYLRRKGISAHGIRFTDKGALAVPMLDISGRIHGLQFILDKTKHAETIKKHNGRDKQFWPAGVVKKSHFHLIGSPTNLLLIAEGYATAASIHEATGFPVAVAFDAGNLQSVAQALHKRYPHANIVICADDDAFSHCKHCQQPVNINLSATCPHCKEPHGKRNAGAEFAELAALAVNGRVIAPRFADPEARFDHYFRNQGKLTDFNDLHLTDGLHTVRTQLESALLQFGWLATAKARDVTPQGGGDNTNLKPIDTTDELLERFSLVYGKGGTLFDHHEHMLVALSDMQHACMSREIHRRWSESPLRSIVREENVGFDPAGEDKNITCNLWDKWPTVPKAGNCDGLIGLLQHMCSGEHNSMELTQWVVKWLAYPIQHPGAKMRTALVFHGLQGGGKNQFFEAIMQIYGRYGRIIDQAAVEDKFNDWASKKLFMIADEVVARSDLYHIKNKLKCLITGEWIRINPKNIGAYEEKNHVNMVFLSNERMPVVLEEDDRRHCVIWTAPPKNGEYYKAIANEISNGGVEALFDWLLNIDLGDFNEHSKPPMTTAKLELINLGKDSVLRFYDDWVEGEIDGVPNMPVLSDDIYDLYKHWCGRQGVKASPLNKAIDHIAKRPGASKERKRYMNGVKQSNPKTFIYPAKCIEMNPGNSESAWLGQCVEDFRTAVKEYKGGAYD
jgi:putative DNA primase/helicase